MFKYAPVSVYNAYINAYVDVYMCTRKIQTGMLTHVHFSWAAPFVPAVQGFLRKRLQWQRRKTPARSLRASCEILPGGVHWPYLFKVFVISLAARCGACGRAGHVRGWAGKLTQPRTDPGARGEVEAPGALHPPWLAAPGARLGRWHPAPVQVSLGAPPARAGSCPWQY